MADLRVSQAAIEALDEGAPDLRVSQTAVEALDAGNPALRVSQTVVEVLESLREGPSGGGSVEGGVVNPAASDLATGVKRVFVRLTIPTGSPYPEYAFAETTLNDPPAYFGGQKRALLLDVSPATRELSETVRGTEVRVVLADTDYTFRTLATTATLSGAVMEIFVVEDEVRYLLGEPYRFFCGKVINHRGLSGFRYEFTLRDVLSEHLATLDDAPRMPPGLLNEPEWPGIRPAFENRAIPLVLGQLDDSVELPAGGSVDTIPQGVVPPLILGTLNFQTAFGGVDRDVIACIISQCALAANGIWQAYFNPPDNPYRRYQIPLSFFGVGAWAPGMPGWEDVGVATDYIDYPSPPDPEARRYTPFFVALDHPFAQAFLDGKVLVAFNLFGIAENADGSGNYLSDAPRIWQWLLVNFLYSEYRTGDYAAIPTFAGGHSIVNVASVEAATTRLRTYGGGSYPVGFMLGADGKQVTLRHVLEQLCAGVLMEQGIDRHGRLMVSVEDPSADAAVTFDARADIEDGSFETWIARDEFKNLIEYVYGYRYVPPTAPIEAPPAGEALPKQPVMPYSEWTSGLQRLSSPDGLASNQGVERKLFVENRVVRTTVASSVAARLLERRVGEGPAYEGPRMFRFTTSWQGLMKDGVEIELGTVIGITHLEGVGAAGWTDVRGRVLKITVDAMRARVTLEGRVLFGPNVLP
jgi:hypothetical protein